MAPESVPNAIDSRFTLVGVRKENPTPLLQLDVPWERLMIDVVTPYDAGELFFLDGAPVRATDLDHLKILLNSVGFGRAITSLNWNLRTSPANAKEIYAKQYTTFLNALLREHCRDVTSQVISAFRTEVKPRPKDRLPDNKVLFDAAIKIFFEGMKAWTNS